MPPAPAKTRRYGEGTAVVPLRCKNRACLPASAGRLAWALVIAMTVALSSPFSCASCPDAGFAAFAYASTPSAEKAPQADDRSDASEAADGTGSSEYPEDPEDEAVEDDETPMTSGLGGGEPVSDGIGPGSFAIVGIMAIGAFFFVLMRKLNGNIKDMNRIFK